jgi:hypothetical protein
MSDFDPQEEFKRALSTPALPSSSTALEAKLQDNVDKISKIHIKRLLIFVHEEVKALVETIYNSHHQSANRTRRYHVEIRNMFDTPLSGEETSRVLAFLEGGIVALAPARGSGCESVAELEATLSVAYCEVLAGQIRTFEAENREIQALLSQRQAAA